MSAKKVNDFVVRFANVNGTGSASANALFTKAIFRMGVPATPKNIFPSNIQGLPTWYEVRVSDKGFLGRREGIDLMVSVNPQSMPKDYSDTQSGGYFVYDSTKPLPPNFDRTDIVHIGIPLTEICNREFSDPRQRQLFKNIIYVGALSELFKIEFEVLEQLISEQFKGKEKFIEPNIKALKLGVQFAKEKLDIDFQLLVERRDLIRNKILISGNSACALGAIYAGATIAAWYPITPSTSVVDAFAKYAAKYRVDQQSGKNKYAIIQAEDELAAIGVVMGAMWNGARAFTATSGPGLSLMQEFLGLGYFAEVPTVLIDVQRTGPSTGMPTRTQQSDILLAAYASHGDTKHPLLFPSTPKECFEMTSLAFDLSEKLQTPIILMTDLDLGMNEHICEPLQWSDSKIYERGKVLSAEDLEKIYNFKSNGNKIVSAPEEKIEQEVEVDQAHDPLTVYGGRFGRYLDIEGDGIPYRTIPGTHPTLGAFVTRGSSRDEFAVYTEDSNAYRRNMERLAKKWETTKTLMPEPEIMLAAQSLREEENGFTGSSGNFTDAGIIYFGTTRFAAEEALEMLREDGVLLDSMRALAFPFGQAFRDFITGHEKIFVIEQNRDAQFRSLIMIELGTPSTKLVPILNFDGLPITADFIYRKIKDNLSQTKD
ncbi:MAG TPA: 2-oxoacid:acceptor oxidoreductase subunit alpha [Pyrinomonadaceae bacterium]|nr:2-oxoacid:acceptor oxidoreductase subunit alpha [Pyrinomonadaceae bacterium]